MHETANWGKIQQSIYEISLQTNTPTLTLNCEPKRGPSRRPQKPETPPPIISSIACKYEVHGNPSSPWTKTPQGGGQKQKQHPKYIYIYWKHIECIVLLYVLYMENTMFSLICAWIIFWANNRNAGDLSRSLWRHCNALPIARISAWPQFRNFKAIDWIQYVIDDSI